ncbi:helix-turn-helix domain-containing protein [Sphingomonas sp. DBB INV C78]|uniref:AraC family transcriptional regulator n=1 Tax=Sphingomonas sp. DBB INV C78 TaxID=3349434 RepID=UPI0036D26439
MTGGIINKDPLSRLRAERVVVRLLTLLDRKRANIPAILAESGVRQPLGALLEGGLGRVDETTLRLLSSRASLAATDLQAKAIGRPPFRGSDWHLLFYCLVNARTLREAIATMVQLFDAIDGRLGLARMATARGEAVLVYEGDRGDDAELAFSVALNGMLNIHEIFGWLIGRPLGGTVELDFPETMRPLADEDLMPFRLTLEATAPTLRFASRLLDEPVIRSIDDCVALPSLIFYFGLAQADHPAAVADRTRRLLARTLREDRHILSLDELGRQIGIGSMTLRRRLASAGTSFQELKDGARRDLALDLMANKALSIEEIAERVGFCDSDALRAAVRTWVGMSPTDYRRTLDEAPGP